MITSQLFASGDLVSSLPGILTGVAEVAGLAGTGIGFLIRKRRQAKRERDRALTAATTASVETREKLEKALADAHASDLKSRDERIHDLSAQVEALTKALVHRDD